MFELYIIRHGLADKKPEDETKDYDRPLKKKGKETMKEVAKGLKELKVSFDEVLTSPLLRSLETAEIINKYCGNSKKVTVTDLLKPESSYTKLIKLLNQHKAPTKVAIVGHEPFLSGFASYCLSKNKTSLLNLKKGSVLMLETGKIIKPGECKLSWLMEPRQIIQN